jgi:cytochrome c551/c552
MCLSCHGSDAQIPGPVKKQIASSYSKDLATGYKAGELRGAFSVKIPLRASPAR